MDIRLDDPMAPHVADLLAHHLAELRSVMASHAFALDASGLSAGNVSFWTAWNDDSLAGFVALKQHDPRHGELKSMRAAPAARRSGVGRALLMHVIGVARDRGYARLSLETGTAPLHAPAVALYRSAGFENCEAFADYAPSPHNQFMALDLRQCRPKVRHVIPGLTRDPASLRAGTKENRVPGQARDDRKKHRSPAPLIAAGQPISSRGAV